jgi:hypothetical protein
VPIFPIPLKGAIPGNARAWYVRTLESVVSTRFQASPESIHFS